MYLTFFFDSAVIVLHSDVSATPRTDVPSSLRRVICHSVVVADDIH
jgi:hypothetical protein